MRSTIVEGLLFSSKLLAIVFFISGMPAPSHAATNIAQDSIFRFHLPSEPSSLDPAKFSSTDASYLFANVYRGLYEYNSTTGLVPRGAKSCAWISDLILECELNPKMKWSNGDVIKADDYVTTFRHLVEKDSKALGVELLKHLQNALACFRGELPTEKLGISALSSSKLRFQFSHPDPDFLYKLTSVILAPQKSPQFPTRDKSHTWNFSGPYVIKSWDLNKKIRLEPNPFYDFAYGDAKARPNVEVLFVDDDLTALQLYEAKTLTFLRRLPIAQIYHYNKRADFFQLPVARFDYVGFGDETLKYPRLREALSLALDYDELKTLYKALGRPGCPSLPETYFNGSLCIKPNVKRAKDLFAKLPKDVRDRRYQFYFSKLGGEDVQKGMEWMQAQWRKNLGLKVDLVPTEQGVYLQKLGQSPPDIFRKGVGLERPTCLSALETFAKGGSENFLKFQNDQYEDLLSKLAKEKSSDRKRAFCTEGIQILMEAFALIPLGRIHFTLLARPAWTGWQMNEMNQLDLQNLVFKTTP